MKNSFLSLVSATCIFSFTTLYGASSDTPNDIREISNTLVKLIRDPSEIINFEQMDTITAIPRGIDNSGKAVTHEKSKLTLVCTGDSLQVSNQQGTNIWNHTQRNILSVKWDAGGEQVVIHCEYPGYVTYRVSYESTLCKLNAQQLAFLRHCNQHWTSTEKPVTVATHDFYNTYKNLPNKLRRDALFELSDEMRRQARWDYCKSLIASGWNLFCNIYCRERYW